MNWLLSLLPSSMSVRQHSAISSSQSMTAHGKQQRAAHLQCLDVLEATVTKAGHGEYHSPCIWRQLRQAQLDLQPEGCRQRPERAVPVAAVPAAATGARQSVQSLILLHTLKWQLPNKFSAVEAVFHAIRPGGVGCNIVRISTHTERLASSSAL